MLLFAAAPLPGSPNATASLCSSRDSPSRFTTDDMLVPEEDREEAMRRNQGLEHDFIVLSRDQEVDTYGQEQLYAAALCVSHVLFSVP